MVSCIPLWDTPQWCHTVAPVGKRSSRSEKELLQLLLRDVRREAGLRQVDVARRLGLPQSFVSKYESGERRLDILEMRDVCEALGISLPTFARRLDRLLSRNR